MEPTGFAKLAAMAETDTSETTDAAPFSGRTAWTRNLQTPLRAFLATETGSAAILLAAVVAALIWVNVDQASYERLWSTTLSIHVGSYSISQDLQAWINSGLMAFFFFVIGLEARREFDLGELRERRRVALPLLAGIGGMAVPVLIYVAINAGHDSIHGWGTAMSTDTAFALGLLALVGSGLPDRLRAYLLTVAVVDDIVALLVIAVAYSGSISVGPLLVAFGLFACILLVRAADIHVGLIYFLLGTAVWVAFYESGVDPVVAGLMGGVIALAYPAQRTDLERRATSSASSASSRPATWRARRSWGAAVGRIAERTAAVALASVDELRDRAALRAGERRRPPERRVPLDGVHVAHHARDHLRLRPRQADRNGRIDVARDPAQRRTAEASSRLGVGAGAGTIAGIGFTVSILIADLAFHGTQLDEAKVGTLTAALLGGDAHLAPRPSPRSGCRGDGGSGCCSARLT